MRLRTLLVCVALLLCVGCARIETQPTLIPLPEFVTATLPPVTALVASPTPLPPTPMPTLAPVEGTTTSEINVRAEPSTASTSYGTIPAFSKVQVLGKDISGAWYRVAFDSAPDGAGWVRADFVQVQSTAEIQVLGAGTGDGSDVSGLVLRGVYVRTGPGKEFDSLGLLNQNDVVAIQGKDSSGRWMKINYAPAADGSGWVAAEYLQIANVESIPILAEDATPTEQTANPISTSSSGSAPLAISEGDTMESPLASFLFSPTAQHSGQVQGIVSALQGDLDDWFTLESTQPKIIIDLFCESGALQVELWQAGNLTNNHPMPCGTELVLNLSTNQLYHVRLSIPQMSPVDPIAYRITFNVEE